ncbi:MAG: arsenate reductase (glutaredoxin) [Crocinitomicaceae bacterium]
MKIYHNNRCSKSRETLALLKDRVKGIEEFNYLEEEINENELRFIIEKLKINPEDLVRKGESIYKTSFKGKSFTDDEWIEAMIKYPKLIERPIVINGDKVAIGRPPEHVLSIL